jgi:hypothetical protein
LWLYIFYFCLLTDIEQNRIVRANYYLMSEWNMVDLHYARREKIIDILQSERSFGRVIREIQVNFRCSGVTHLVYHLVR